MQNAELFSKQVEEIAKIKEMVSSRISDQNYNKALSTEMGKYQPFYLEVISGYYRKVNLQQFEQVLIIHNVMWEYFKESKNFKTKKVTKELFEKAFIKNRSMISYAAGETIESEGEDIVLSDLNTINAKALFAYAMQSFDNQKRLIEIDLNYQTFIQLCIKSFIECFENHVNKDE